MNKSLTLLTEALRDFLNRWSNFFAVEQFHRKNNKKFTLNQPINWSNTVLWFCFSLNLQYFVCFFCESPGVEYFLAYIFVVYFLKKQGKRRKTKNFCCSPANLENKSSRPLLPAIWLLHRQFFYYFFMELFHSKKIAPSVQKIS